MPDLLAIAADRLAGINRDQMGQIGTYTRGSKSARVTVKFGRTTFQIFGGGDVQTSYESIDLILHADQAKFGDAPFTPLAGDKFKPDLTGATYEVNAPGSEPVYRYVDGFRRELRIHTKCVG